MPHIRPIQPHEVEAAKHVIFVTAHAIFDSTIPLEQAIARYAHELQDMDDIPRNYLQGGAFLVMTNGKNIIGTGAIRRLDDATCELKRLWLLPRFQGRGLGYRMMQALLAEAHQRGYQRMRLKTDPLHQTRALAFYRRLGFVDIPLYGEDDGDICLEMAVTGGNVLS